MLLRRQLLLTGLMGASIGLPYVLGNAPEWASQATSGWEAHDDEPDAHHAGLADSAARPKDVPLEGLPTAHVAEVLRFDITPDWVYQHWSRKSTALADLDYHGVRVPLVTGTKIGDLAGSLTYYFSQQGRLERIAFTGRTGDPQELISLLTARYGFRSQRPVVAGEQLYEVRWNDRPMSRLKIRPASVVWAAAPHASFEIELEMQRPGAGRYLSGA